MPVEKKRLCSWCSTTGWRGIYPARHGSARSARHRAAGPRRRSARHIRSSLKPESNSTTQVLTSTGNRSDRRRGTFASTAYPGHCGLFRSPPAITGAVEGQLGAEVTSGDYETTDDRGRGAQLRLNFRRQSVTVGVTLLQVFQLAVRSDRSPDPCGHRPRGSGIVGD